MPGLPKIDIIFKKLATTLVQRSARGIACIVVKDATAGTAVNTYTLLSEVVKTEYTVENYKAIEDCFLSGPYKLIVIKVANNATFDDVKEQLEQVKYNYVCYVDSSSQAALVTYIKDKNTTNKSRQVKAVVFNATTPDDKHIINFVNETVKRKSDDTAIDGVKYLPRLTALLAANPMDQSVTYKNLTDIDGVSEPTGVEALIAAGKFVIINDDGEPKIARGVTSLVTVTETNPEDFKKIIIVESADMIQEDIYQTFKNYYIGKFKNKYDNQALLIGTILSYFGELEREDVLDPNFENVVEIDVDKQRQILIDKGKPAQDWTDFKVKTSTISSNVYLTGNIKITDAMEDMELIIELD